MVLQGLQRGAGMSFLLPEAELGAVMWSGSVNEKAHCHLDAKAVAGMFNLKSQDLGWDF